MQTTPSFVTIVILSVFLAVPLTPSCRRDSTEQPIRIGLSGPLTGPEAQTGQDMRDGALLAIEEVNSKGGVLGKRLELVQRDDKADPKEAVNVAKFFASDSSIVAVVGHLNSDCSIAAARVYEQAKMAMVTPVSTSDALTEKGYSTVFRVPIRNSVQGSAAAEFVAKKGFRRIAILDDGGAYGQGVADEFEKALQIYVAHGEAKVVLRERFDKNEVDFRPLLAKIDGVKADLVYFGGMYPAGGVFLRQSEELGLKFTLVGGDGLFAPKFIELAGKAAERAYVTFIAPLPTDISKAHPFFVRFESRFGSPPVVYAPLAYDAVMVIVEAIRKAETAERSAIVRTLHSPGFEYQGVTGTIKFDERGEGVARKPFMYRVIGNRFVLVEDF